MADNTSVDLAGVPGDNSPTGCGWVRIIDVVVIGA